MRIWRDRGRYRGLDIGPAYYETQARLILLPIDDDKEDTMAKISATFGSSYYNSDDFDGKGQTLTIERVTNEEVGKEERLVVYFHEEEGKGLPLNKTNALAIAEKFGDETDDWEGGKLKIYRDSTMFNGKKTACIRVKPMEMPPKG